MVQKRKTITVHNVDIVISTQKDSEYISLTDIARAKNAHEPKTVVQNWMRTTFTIEFLGLWEQINNPNFKGVEFDAFKNESGANSFTLSPQRWIETTNAIGLISKSGRYGGTFAHKDIAFEFASWISAEFKLYLIKEFQRLKEEENIRLQLGWDAKRQLTKINYRIHTDSIKKHLIPAEITKQEAQNIYASEADMLNKALFGLTAQEWERKHPKLDGNMRDYASVEQLICLANLETLNARFIEEGKAQSERLLILNAIAIDQMKSLLVSPGVKKLKEKS